MLNSFCESKTADKSGGQRSQISLRSCAVCEAASTSAWEQALGRKVCSGQRGAVTILIPEDSANFKCRLFGRRHDVLFLGSSWILRVLELNLLKTHKRKVRILAQVKRERTNSHLQDHLTGKLSPLIKVSLLPTARGDSSRKPQLDRTQRSEDGREPN